jgi:hypothetical protein
VDDVMDDDLEDEEEEGDKILKQVLDEIGVGISQQVRPTRQVSLARVALDVGLSTTTTVADSIAPLSLLTHQPAWLLPPHWLSANPLLLPTALLLHLGTPILAVLVVLAAAEIWRTKTPYKPAWMPFAGDKFTLLENYTPSDHRYFSSDLNGGITLVLVLLFGLARNQFDCLRTFDCTRTIACRVRSWFLPYSIMRVDTIN